MESKLSGLATSATEPSCWPNSEEMSVCLSVYVFVSMLISTVWELLVTIPGKGSGLQDQRLSFSIGLS